MKHQVRVDGGRGGGQASFTRRSKRAPIPRAGRLPYVCIFAGLLGMLGLVATGTFCSAFEGNEDPASSKNPKEAFMADSDKLTREEGERLIFLARKTIEARLFEREVMPEEGMEMTSKYAEKRGTFVTLTLDGGLRGCIGHILPRESVLEGVKENALNAAFRDPRFQPLSADEWDHVKVEVSILTDPKPLAYDDAADLLEKLRTGVDGVILRKGMHQATFLPQVWDQLPRKSDFLTHLCLKAGLEADAWKTRKLEVSTYQVQAFEE